MILHQLFCDIDDFCRDYLPDWKKTQIATGDKKRNRSKCLCESEIMTLVVYFQISGYRTFKHFYLRHARVYWRQAFPGLPSDNRFVELMAAVLNPLATFMQSRCAKSQGIAFVDSTALRVCENSRIPRHKTFADYAGRSQSSTGWFYGFKLHFTVNDCGEPLSFCFNSLEHSRHRSLINFLVSAVAALVAYSYQPKNPLSICALPIYYR